jgi:hypothetical protein
MINIQTSSPKQVLLRLPDDLAAKLARAVAPRQRNKFLVDLVRRELDREDAAMIAACAAMNALEARDPEFAREGAEWVHADLTGSVDDWDADFDAETFSREAAVAQAALRAPPTNPGKA